MKFTEADINYMNSLNSNDQSAKVSDCQFDLSAMNFLANEASSNGMPEIGKSISDKINFLARSVPMNNQQR